MNQLLALRSYYKDFPISWAAHEQVATLLVRRIAEEAILDVDAAAAKG